MSLLQANIRERPEGLKETARYSVIEVNGTGITVEPGLISELDRTVPSSTRFSSRQPSGVFV